MRCPGTLASPFCDAKVRRDGQGFIGGTSLSFREMVRSIYWFEL